MNTKNILLALLVVGLQLVSVAQPVNDDPCNAVPLGLSSVCNYMTFTNVDATPTGGLPSPGCASYSGGDVWFRFTMPNNGYHVVLELEAADITNGGMAVYSGSNCTGLTLVACDDNSGNGNMPRLKVDDGCNFINAGSTFWVRVWENGNDTVGNFGICAYAEAPDAPAGTSTCSIYPPAGNTCCDAVLLTDLLDGYCGNTGGYNDQPMSIPGFCAQIENNSWLAFRASDTNVSIELTSSACSIGNGIQSAIFSTSDCSSFTLVSNCANNLLTAVDTLNASGLTIGETYYLMVDGWAADTCDYSIRVLSGVENTNVSVTDNIICSGEMVTLQANTSGIGPYTYAWSPATSLNDSTLQNPTASPTISTDYFVTITDPNGSNTYSVSVIVYQGIPGLPTIIGDTIICEGTTANYMASAAEAAGYTWSVSGGVSFSASGSSLSADWTTEGTYSLCVSANNECGIGTQTCRTVNVIAAPDISATNPAPVCAPNTIDLSTVSISNASTGSGPLSYYSSQADAIAGTSALASSIVNSSGTYWIRMESLPDCFDVTSVDVTIENPQITITDPARTCQPQLIDLSSVIVTEANSLTGTRTYYSDSIDAVNNNNILSSSSVGVSGRYFVRFETINGCFDVAGVNVNIDPTPMVNTIGPLFVCDGGTVDLDTITINDTNNSSIVYKEFFDSKLLADINLFPIANYVVTSGVYFVRVETVYGCFDVDSIIIQDYPIPTGFIDGDNTVCAGDSADITFNFSEPGLFSGTYTDGTTVFNFNDVLNGDRIRLEVNSNTTYTLTSLVSENGCSGTVSGPPVNLQVYTTPTGTLLGTTTICEGGSADLVFSLNGNGPFTVVYTDGSNNITRTNIDSGDVEVVSPTVSTNYSLIEVTDANGCIGSISGTAIVQIATSPQVIQTDIECNSTSTEYRLIIQLTGGDTSSIIVNGGNGVHDPVNHTFTSDWQPSGTNYTFSITDVNGCDPAIVLGTHTCSCITASGTMSNDPLIVCGEETANALYSNDGTEDANDARAYYLHDQSGTSLGNVVAVSNTPEFTYDPVMTYGSTYYISTVVGNDDGSGFPDITPGADPCLSISTGQPVTFYPKPTASVVGTSTICQGDTAYLDLNLDGVGPFTVEYTDGTDTYVVTGLQSGDRVALAPSTSTNYRLARVRGSDPLQCEGEIDPVLSEVMVTVIERPRVNNFQVICNATGTAYQLVFDLSGGNSNSYSISGDTSLTLAAGVTFTSPWYNSGTTYQLYFDDGGTCSPMSFSGTEYCLCTTDIMPVITTIQGISCPGDADAVLSVRNENGVAPFQYSWSTGQSDTLLTDLGPGMYYVTMTDQNNCQSEDSIFIEDPLAITANVVARDPDCSGRSTGQIQLVDIGGGAGQYVYFIDGVFSNTGRIFNELEANIDYEIMIEDANGCTWVDTIQLDEAEPFTVDLGRDTAISLGDSLFLEIQASGPIDTFFWEPQEVIPCLSCTGMAISPEFSVTYSVTVVKAGGICRASDEMRVTVNREVPVYIPNIFTPNGDFKNERFTVYGNTAVERVAVFRIFNRWGELVFEGLDFPPGNEAYGWDGRRGGVEQLPIGVYVYYAEVILSDGTRERVEGDVTLMR